MTFVCACVPCLRNQELQEQGFVGTLTTSVVHIDHLALDSNFNIHFLLDSELSKAQNGTENKVWSGRSKRSHFLGSFR